MDFETKWEWIEFGPGEDKDGSSINGKTNNPSDIKLQVALTYRIREVYLDEIYEKYPARNYHKDLILIAKVSSFLSPLGRYL